MRTLWFRLNVDGEAPVMGALVGLRVSDDLAADSPTLRVQLSLPLWTPEGFKNYELDALFREVGPKNAKRFFQRGMKAQD